MNRTNHPDLTAIHCNPAEVAALCRDDGLLIKLAERHPDGWVWDMTEDGGALLMPPANHELFRGCEAEFQDLNEHEEYLLKLLLNPADASLIRAGATHTPTHA